MAYTTEAEILERAQALCGKTYRQLLSLCRCAVAVPSGKGRFGALIESCYGIKTNSRPAPDFEEAGIELKVTPVLKYAAGSKKTGYHAKERLVCNIIDYITEAEASGFYDSSFAHKCARMLIFFYLTDPHADAFEERLLDYSLMVLRDLPPHDLATIVHDWEIIHAKILAGRAHEISESDTDYLAACTKGVNAASMRKQPFSPILAKQRAYALKSSYMTAYFGRSRTQTEAASLYRSDDAAEPLEIFVANRVGKHLGRKLSDLSREFGVPLTGKSCAANIIRKIFKTEISSPDDILEFRKANIRVKTVRFEPDGRLRESMSFAAFRAGGLMAEPDWETSALHDFFAETRFLFVVLRKSSDGDVIFESVRFWNMPPTDLNGDVRAVWEKTREAIRSGNVYVRTPSGQRRRSKFPGEKDGPVAHVRPHAQNSRDIDDTWPHVIPFTKHCFWLNRSYIKGILAHV